MIFKALKGAKKLKDVKMLKVKPLSERKTFGGGNAEKIMKSLQDVKKTRIQTEQAANKYRMKYEGFEGGKRKPLKSSAKSDIKIAQDARARRAKTRKEQAGAVGVGSASIAAVGALGKKYEEKKKAKKTEGMEERVGKAKGGMAKKKFPDLTGDGKVTRADILKGRKVFKDGGCVQIKGWGKARKR